MIKFKGKTYFNKFELECKGSGKLILAEGFERELLELRLQYNAPMIITSACRSLEHNTLVGGSKNSYHICDDGRGTCAIDIYCDNGKDRLNFTTLAIKRGWSVGISSKRFIHLDARFLLNQPQVIFGY